MNCTKMNCQVGSEALKHAQSSVTFEIFFPLLYPYALGAPEWRHVVSEGKFWTRSCLQSDLKFIDLEII